MSVVFSKWGSFGRAGNMMFQAAAVLGYAKKYNMDWTLPPQPKFESWFEGNFNTSQIIPVHPVYPEPTFEYIKIPYFENVDLQGYFQSSRYWEHCVDAVRRLFTFKKELRNSVIDNWEVILHDDPISLHVRRTDYLNLQDYLPVLPMSYYQEALSRFEPNRPVLIFSDDIAWCRTAFVGDRYAFANGSEEQDLCLMTLCGDHIIGNSSFSWWGAFLANSKKVIAPNQEKWFGPRANHDTKDLIPQNQNWIRI